MIGIIKYNNTTYKVTEIPRTQKLDKIESDCKDFILQLVNQFNKRQINAFADCPEFDLWDEVWTMRTTVLGTDIASQIPALKEMEKILEEIEQSK